MVFFKLLITINGVPLSPERLRLHEFTQSAMAYAAVASLLQTLHNLPPETYPDSQIKNLHDNLTSLQSSLEKIFPVTRTLKGPVETLESKIRDAVFESQNTIESRVLSLEYKQTPGGLPEITEVFEGIKARVEEIANSDEIKRTGPRKDDSLIDEPVSSRFTSRSKTTKIVGQEEDRRRVTEELKSEKDELLIAPILGVPGIGKTTLARSIYDDRRMEDAFLARAWVTVSSEFNFREIFMKLLASIETKGQKGDESISSNKLGVSRESDENLAQRLKQTLYDTRYLVVVDDVWDASAWDKIKEYFPDNKNGSRIILTTRFKKVADHVKSGFRLEMKPLNPKNSWILLCYRVFGDGNCPPNLENVGKKISESCNGLPLSLTVIGGQLSQERKTVGYWNIVEQDLNAAAANKIVGQHKLFNQVKAELDSPEKKRQIVTVVGMAGIGKTTLARSVYKEKTQYEFPVRAWVKLSSEFNFRNVFRELLDSIETSHQKGYDSISNETCVNHEHDVDVAECFRRDFLYDKRYLVVIDDVWDGKDWDKIERYFPDNGNRSRIIVTTRSKPVAEYVKPSGPHLEVERLGREDSWTLLSSRVFGNGKCPPELEAVGREIAKKCDGLPLSLTVIGGKLYQETRTPEHWNKVKEDKHAAAAAAAEDTDDPDDRYLEILTLSYNHLPWKHKGCFLYMGAFPEDSEILITKLVRLWVAEGILKALKDSKDAIIQAVAKKGNEATLEEAAKNLLTELIDRNLFTIRKFGPDGKIKSCGIHDSLREIAVRECGKEKFFHGIKRYSNPLGKETDAEKYRRLSVHKNILMCMEEVNTSTSSVTYARSFLYAGRHHHHPYPYDIAFKYLRVLDALTVYFIEFPNEVVEMLHLSYLSLTYNGKLPSTIAKLGKLRVLIVRQHPKIIFLGTSILPNEIWSMPELRHLFFTETEFPDFSGVDFLVKDLNNLQSLSSVNAASCRLEVLEKIPNLKKLVTWLAAPPREPEGLDFHIHTLEKLEIFKFTVLNPIPGSRIKFNPGLAFPRMLRKLCLSGCGIPWEDMSIIGQLEHLEVLKLREFAFHGYPREVEEQVIEDDDDDDGDDEEEQDPEEKVSVWKPKPREFSELKYLLLEALDLEVWEAEDIHFPSLETLIIRHCYDLEEIPEKIGDIGPLELIEMVDCSPSAVDSAREIKRLQDGNKKENGMSLQVRIYSSWE